MPFVSYLDAAEFIGMSPSSIARYVETGILPIYELPSPTGGSPVRRVRTEDLEALATPIQPFSPGCATRAQIARLIRKPKPKRRVVL
jgi:hypothetical protein